MQSTKEITVSALRSWLEAGTEVNIVDIRPIQERTEWFIPGSIYFDAYDKLKTNDPLALHGLHLNKTIPVVTICAGGKTSLIAAALLQEKGYDAYSLQDGMKGWSLSWNTAKLSFPDFEVIQFRRTGKGCLSYLLSSNREAIIVDPSLSVEVYQEELQKNKLVLKYVIETHIHADHLSRARHLAESSNAALYLPVSDKVSFAFNPVTAATVFTIGNISMKAIPTPGHTLESTSYLIDDKLLLTGDTLFITGVGRPDLKASNDEAVQKSKMLYQSLQTLLALDEKLIVLPAHTSKPVDFDHIPLRSTIGNIKAGFAMLKLSEEEFVSEILQRIPPAPANYLTIAEKNIQGDFNDINPIDLEAGANRCAVS
ncbi:MAG: MBL fold metallo-hydrolase [Lacibacter sp.]|nr:MBL fold metallo-hydrolase [Lacibacter sp.]